MIRCLLDVNVVLDLVLDRRPHSDEAALLWAAAEQKHVEAFVPAHGITTVFYVARRHKGVAFAREAVRQILRVPGVAAVDAATLRRAQALDWGDFEDAVCAAAAEAAACDLLVTRDPSGFVHSPVVVVDPVTAVSMIRGETGPAGVSERPSPAYRKGKPRRHPRSSRR